MSNEAYLAEGTTLKINGAGDADYRLWAGELGPEDGTISARIDLGAAPRPYLYRWRCKCAWQANPVKGGVLKLYKSESDGTYADGDIATAAMGLGFADALVNCRQFGQVVVDTADTSAQIAGGVVEIHERYVSIIIWNAGGTMLSVNESDFIFTLTPIFDQQQA